MPRKKLSRNAPCPCGSGRKYKHCCYGKDLEENEADLGLAPKRQRPPQYPIGTVALYSPDDKTTTKIAAGVILHDKAKPIVMRWVATDVTTNPKVQQDGTHRERPPFVVPRRRRRCERGTSTTTSSRLYSSHLRDPQAAAARQAHDHQVPLRVCRPAGFWHEVGQDRGEFTAGGLPARLRYSW